MKNFEGLGYREKDISYSCKLRAYLGEKERERESDRKTNLAMYVHFKIKALEHFFGQNLFIFYCKAFILKYLQNCKVEFFYN